MVRTLHHGGRGGHGGRKRRRLSVGADTRVRPYPWVTRSGTAILRFVCVLCVLGGGESPAFAAVGDYLGKPVASVSFVLEGRTVDDQRVAELVETIVDQPLSMVQV